MRCGLAHTHSSCLRRCDLCGIFFCVFPSPSPIHELTSWAPQGTTCVRAVMHPEHFVVMKWPPRIIKCVICGPAACEMSFFVVTVCSFYFYNATRLITIHYFIEVEYVFSYTHKLFSLLKETQSILLK